MPEEQNPGQTLMTVTGVSSGIRSPSSRAKKTFKSFDLGYQLLALSLDNDDNTECEPMVTSGARNWGHPQPGFGIGFVVPGFQDPSAI